jgi:hypothetical protein
VRCKKYYHMFSNLLKFRQARSSSIKIDYLRCLEFAFHLNNIMLRCLVFVGYSNINFRRCVVQVRSYTITKAVSPKISCLKNTLIGKGSHVAAHPQPATTLHINGSFRCKGQPNIKKIRRVLLKLVIIL